MRLLRTIFALYLFSFLSFSPSVAGGHAFLVHAEPGAGSVVRASPSHIRIWFDSPLEPAACVIHVQNATGERVDGNDSRVDNKDPKLLEVSLPLLPSGKYRVIWHVMSLDGHKVEGDYTFSVQGTE
jgi:methionine-rich copper-binding protein CopC